MDIVIKPAPFYTMKQTREDAIVHSDAPRSAGGLSSFSDNALIGRIQASDAAAADVLVQRYQNRAYAIAFSMCGNDADDAWDLTQEAFLKAFKYLKKFKKESSFYTWFYRILVNTCIDARRKKQRWKKLFFFRRSDDKISDPLSQPDQMPDPSVMNDPETVLNVRELDAEVREALETLSEKQRTAFQLKVFHGMTIPEIAEITGAAQGTVKTHLFRATRFLREQLKEYSAERHNQTI